MNCKEAIESHLRSKFIGTEVNFLQTSLQITKNSQSYSIAFDQDFEEELNIDLHDCIINSNANEPYVSYSLGDRKFYFVLEKEDTSQTQQEIRLKTTDGSRTIVVISEMNANKMFFLLNLKNFFNFQNTQTHIHELIDRNRNFVFCEMDLTNFQQNEKTKNDIINTVIANVSFLFNVHFKNPNSTIEYKITLPNISDQVQKMPSVVFDKKPTNYFLMAEHLQYAHYRYLEYYHVLEYYFNDMIRDEVIKSIKSLIYSVTTNSRTESLYNDFEKIAKNVIKPDDLNESGQIHRIVEYSFNTGILTENIKCKIENKKKKYGFEAIDFSSDSLTKQIASRLYLIRNQIVHTKNNDSRGDAIAIDKEFIEFINDGHMELIRALAYNLLLKKAIKP